VIISGTSVEEEMFLERGGVVKIDTEVIEYYGKYINPYPANVENRVSS
jgi:hypothetical protein